MKVFVVNDDKEKKRKVSIMTIMKLFSLKHGVDKNTMRKKNTA